MSLNDDDVFHACKCVDEMDRADIDLNELPESSDSSSEGEEKNDFDLNKPPKSDN